MMKKLLVMLMALMMFAASGYAEKSEAEQQPTRDGKVTLSDSLKTHYQKLKEYSIVEFPFLKPNTTILVSNDCTVRFNQAVKHTIIYFYKEKVALLNYEFKDPKAKDLIVTAINQEFNSPVVERKHSKKTTDNYTSETYEWDVIVGGIVLTYRNHPILGESLTLSYIIKGVIDDPTYLNSELPTVTGM